MRQRDRLELSSLHPALPQGTKQEPPRGLGEARPGSCWPLTSPVANATKFSTVLGTVLPKSPMTTRPTSSSPIRRSKNTLGAGGGHGWR